ncbi:hypothetical protein [Nocardia sp. MH4]|uniref:hypothetical protein n=1 Tax=Nocardia sp. MH4 TaxID=1768677 RepID=UPI001C4E6FA9|nr:hypothetical protein [Nocardia sp. MH4]
MPGRIHWDDPHLRERYSGTRAAMQASRGNDLLGAAFPRRDPTRYALYNRCWRAPPWRGRCHSRSGC